MKPPAFQFYADDFIGGTTTMTTTEVGAYIMLLCHQWSAGEIPNDERRLFAITRTNNEAHNEAAVRYVVAEKFSICEDGKLRNIRMESVRTINKEFKTKSSNGGKASAAKRCGDSEWGKRMAAQRSGNEAANEPSNEATSEAVTNSPSPSPSPITLLTESAMPPSVEKVLKAKKPKPEAPDPRREEFVSIFREFIESAGVQYDRPNAADNAQLKTMLKRKPDMSAEDWRDYLIYINDNSRGQYAPTLLKDCGSIALVCSKIDRIQTYKDREGK